MSDAPRPLPPKKDVTLALLEESSVFIHLDPRKEAVVVPKWFQNQPQLVLQVGLNMPIPIRDLRVEEDAVTCTLSFNRSPFWCSLPWTAIYALVGEDGRGMVWPEDVPPEVAAQMRREAAQPAKPPPAAKKPRPKLAPVGEDGEASTRKRPRDEAKASEKESRRPAPLAAAPAPASSGGASRGGLRSVGGRQGERPSPAPLRAVPPAEVSRPQSTVDAEDEVASSPTPPAAVPGKKGKRELPPYLRVIK